MSLYLEISGRRTGKTARLIEAAISSANDGNNVLVITHNAQWKRSLYDYIYKAVCEKYTNRRAKYINHKIKVCSQYEIRKMAEMEFNEEHSIFNEFHIFYDEFDFLNFTENKIPIMDNGYYCTTPKFLRESLLPPDDTRDDVLLYLYNQNDIVYENNINTALAFDIHNKDLSETEKFGVIACI